MYKSRDVLAGLRCVQAGVAILEALAIIQKTAFCQVRACLICISFCSLVLIACFSLQR